MSGDEEVQALIRVDGRVQGVYYRASAQEKAQSLGLHGYVRNTSDGRVELRARALAFDPLDALLQPVATLLREPAGAEEDRERDHRDPRTERPRLAVRSVRRSSDRNRSGVDWHGHLLSLPAVSAEG